jgi:site-specific DNA recombinase
MAWSYACSGHWNGRACSNHVRVRRDAIERIILGGVRRDLLAPERVDRMAQEMYAAYAERMREIAARAETLQREIQELDARITRLHERLKAGDPDLAADELQAGIERAENKRRELFDARPAERENARVLALMREPLSCTASRSTWGSAAISRRQPRRASSCVRCWAKSLWAEYEVQPAALQQGAGTGGRGDRI